MLHLIKYRFLQNLRDYSGLFWALCFPIILGTFFYFAFGNAGLAATGETAWDSIKIAVVKEDISSDNSRRFLSFLEELNGDTVEIINTSSEKDALSKLKEGEITGIYYINESPSLTVGSNGINETILSSLLDTYRQNASIALEIAKSHPEKLADAITVMNDYQTSIHEVSLGGKTMDPMVQYFFALIAFACMSGIYLGIRSSFDSQADLSPLGSRRSVTPTHKLVLILVDMFVLITIHFFNILVLNFVIINIFKISLGDNLPALILVDFMGSTIGITMGIAFGCIRKLSISMKMSFGVLLTLLPGFLAGLMFGNMKNLIELHCPIINRINPAAVLSDAYYCLSVYNDMQRFHRCLIILAVMDIALIFIAFLLIRRERYDSI